MVPLASDSISVFLASFAKDFLEFIPFFIILIILLIISAFFSSSEMAYSSVNIIRLRNYLDEKKKGAKKAVYIAEKFDVTLTTLLIGNNLVNIAATTIAAYFFSRIISNPTLSSILNTIIMTIIILVFGEVIPKLHGKANAEKFALASSGLLYVIIKILFPFSWLLNQLKKPFIKKDKYKDTPYVTEDELESIIDVMEDEGVIDEENAELLQSAINLGDRIAYDIMTPRVDMIAFDIDESIENIKDLFFEYQFSRVPIYEKDKDNIIGILSERDFLTAYIKSSPEHVDVRKLISSPMYVSKSMKVDDLIREMQKQKKHFAIVSDEYGGTSGIVTMEDALEELVGEIYDEFDESDEFDDVEKIDKIEDDLYRVSAEMSLEYFFETMKLGAKPKSNYPSIGGYVYEMCGETPYSGKQIAYHSVYEEHNIDNPVHNEYDIIFTIDEVKSRRIRTILVEIKKK